ncbi:hypothetical protein NDU88_005756 [Pleurodeles waltl]|uniref:Uncharacterized protein n=1 Tax=Pleurodeles waltl TaxID=8319 RepID=A0AAV7VKV9_PLEWA|nr:hypothetical protein NDU88_005756 [Pleurodeles waltl]
MEAVTKCSGTSGGPSGAGASGGPGLHGKSTPEIATKSGSEDKCPVGVEERLQEAHVKKTRQEITEKNKEAASRSDCKLVMRADPSSHWQAVPVAALIWESQSLNKMEHSTTTARRMHDKVMGRYSGH